MESEHDPELDRIKTNQEAGMSDLEAMTSDELRVEEDSLMGEILKHDAGLTQEQRREYRRKAAKTHFVEAIERLHKYVTKLDAPYVIIARQVDIVYRRAWSLWEDSMANANTDWLKHQYREGSNRCVTCGDDLAYADDETMCPKCIAEGDVN